MLTLTFEPTPAALQRGLNGLSRGHLSIVGARGTITSRGRAPDQSMMIFLSIVGLLDGLTPFLEHGRPRRYTFVGDDSSFQFVVERLPGGRIRVTSGGEILDEVPRSEFVRSVWDGVRAFLDRYQAALPPGDMVLDDLLPALVEFQEAFGL